ncbi:hypothetical protein FE257_012248 [Aspergillus nanangensis]|uniref:DUF7732 domain-containing protein n=1 Tax=Aspergillus nanangensis TaxID=2582783 RepID=A0AAD4CG69_ASPNN|nr:hypothetical protein FE257_012248 [Aspergillus nanangensis]
MINSRVLAVFVLLCVALCFASESSTSRNPPAKLTRSSSPLNRGLKWLYKRRRGGGGSDDDSSSSSSSGGGDDYDDDSTSSSGGGPPMCSYTEYVTQEAHNRESYGSFYNEGNGSLNNNTGGYTPEGSGTTPMWDNSTGQWKTLDYYYSFTDRSSGEYSYRGGAGVPYLSGETSPNGVKPRRLDLVFEAATEYPYFGVELCSVSNSSYAYKYAVPFNWTDISMDDETYGEIFTKLLPVYCCCALNTVCGCDDHHRNSSFVPVLLEQLEIGNSPRNTTNVCNVMIDGDMAFIVNGTLGNGSTMADPEMSPTSERALVTTTRVCSAATDQVSGAGDGR